MPHTQTASMAILLIEPDVQYAEALVTALRQEQESSAAQLVPYAVADVADALEQLSHLRFDAVVYALDLPASGLSRQEYELFDRCRALPVIILAEHILPEFELEVDDLGIDQIIAKAGFELQNLPQLLRQLLRRPKAGRTFRRHNRVQALADREFKKLIALNPDAILVLDQNGHVLEANKAAGRLFGKPISQLLGQPFGYPIKTDVPAELKIRAGKTERIAEMRAAKTRWHGKIAVLAAIRDVTDSRQMLRRLRLSELRYRKFFEEDLTGDFICDVEGKLIACNPAFNQIFAEGGETDELPKNLRYFFPAEALFRIFLNKVQKQGKLLHYALKLQRFDGSPVHLIGNFISYSRADGTLLAIKGYLFDNTEGIKLEQELLQAQKLKSIGDLAGNIAHNFNNILTIILGHNSLIKSSEVIRDPDHRFSIKAIDRAVERGAVLVKQILNFARKGQFIFEPVNINSVIEDVYFLINETFPKTIQIEMRLDHDIPELNADQNQIHQSVLNMCVNARDAMPNGGMLMIQTKLLEKARLPEKFLAIASGHRHYVEIAINDTGSGIEKPDLARIFDPFFTTKPAGEGSGLGLSATYGIIRSHQGFIDVASEIGEGSRFAIYLPVHARTISEKVVIPKSSVSVAGGSETLLLVEDETDILNIISRLIAEKGYHILVARNGEEALKIFRQHQKSIDLVVSDMGLPRLNGRQLYYSMRRLNPKVKTILATGYLEPELRYTLLNDGVRGFLQKPYSMTELLGKIRDVLDTNLPPSPPLET